MDFDGDGRTDVISGSLTGELYFFRRRTGGKFAKPVHVKNKHGKEINLGSASTVFAVDWDADGDLDLLIGRISGEVYLVKNDSGGKRLAFGKADKLLALDKKDLGDSHPIAADWDGDGKLDLLIGHSEGGVLWCRNVGTKTHPRLAKPAELIPDSPAPWASDDQRSPNDWGIRAKICCVDWDRDGRLDILMGDCCGGFSKKPDRTPEELKRERSALSKLPKLRASWSAAFRGYQKLLADESVAKADRDRRLKKLREQMIALKKQIANCQKVEEEFQPQRQAHGFVWLFLRQKPASK